MLHAIPLSPRWFDHSNILRIIQIMRPLLYNFPHPTTSVQSVFSPYCQRQCSTPTTQAQSHNTSIRPILPLYTITSSSHTKHFRFSLQNPTDRLQRHSFLLVPPCSATSNPNHTIKISHFILHKSAQFLAAHNPPPPWVSPPPQWINSVSQDTTNHVAKENKCMAKQQTAVVPQVQPMATPSLRTRVQWNVNWRTELQRFYEKQFQRLAS
jgi:hypothetical protein